MKHHIPARHDHPREIKRTGAGGEVFCQSDGLVAFCGSASDQCRLQTRSLYLVGGSIATKSGIRLNKMKFV
jgi:hypothetical protein